MEDHWQAGYGDAVRSLSHPEVLQRPDKLGGVRTFDWKIHDSVDAPGREIHMKEVKGRSRA